MKNPTTVHQLRQATYSAITSVLNIGSVLAEKGINILDDPQFKELFDELRMTDRQIPQKAFQQLRAAISKRTHLQEFPNGKIIHDHYFNAQTGINERAPHRIISYQMVKLPDGRETLGAILLRQRAMPEVLSFFDTMKWLGAEKGYAKNCSKEFLEAVTPVVLMDNGQAKEVKFFLPSPEELGLNLYDKPNFEDLRWEYYGDTPSCGCDYTPCEKRVFRDFSGDTRSCWLRPSYANGEPATCSLRPDGSVDSFWRAEIPCAYTSASVIVGADVEF